MHCCLERTTNHFGLPVASIVTLDHVKEREDVSLLIDLSRRHLEGELMDAPDLAEQQHMLALKGLRRVNLFSRTAQVVADAIFRNWKAAPTNLRILDLACGGGDVTCEVARRLTARGVTAEVIGWDRSATAITFAGKQAATVNAKTNFEVIDALAEIPADQFDVIYCTLFLHHLSNEDSTKLLTQMVRAARRLALVDDLRRSTVGYGLAVLGCRILSRSPIVHVDGPLSVRAAYTETEIESLCKQCDLPLPKIKRHWPHRFLAAWDRTQ